MRPETENFDGVRQLLKLKRCEQPPPGYFNDFSKQVIAQIRAGTGVERESSLDRLTWEVPWMKRLIEAFQVKPALAVSFGAAVCALLVGGVIYSESTEFKPPTMPGIVEVSRVPASAPATPALVLGGINMGTTMPVSTNSSLNPSIQPAGSLFDQFQLQPEPVDYRIPGN